MDLGTALSSTGALKVRNAVVATDYYPFKGGLDLMDPPMSIAPGALIGCLNFEPAIRGGYRRVDGYERFDGHASPSDATFLALALNATTGIVAGQSAVQGGASGTVAYVDATNLAIVLVNTTGTFVTGAVTVGANPFTVTATYANAGATTALTATYGLQKFLYLQGSISALPHATVLGVFPYLDTVYAIASDGTQGHLYKATTTGWQAVPLGIKIQFTAGVYSSSMQPPAEGTLCTGSTSGATFTINRINAMSGTWGTDAAGWIVTSAITGTPVTGETFKDSGGTVLFTYQSNAAQTLPASGVYEFRVFNFNAAQNPSTGYRLYAVNGVGQGFEFEGTQSVFCNIDTGMSPDTPTHLEVHASYLFFSFPGGSLQNSGYQYPLNWNPVFGASARSVGEDVTFLKEDISETLIIGTRKRVWTLSGISTELFQIQVYAANTGAIQWSVEQPGQIIFMEDRGFTTVSASQEYGDFEANSLSDSILTLATSLAANDTPVGAIVTRKKNLYRIAFSSGAVLALGMNAKGQFTGWTECGYPFSPVMYVCGYTQSSGAQQERAFMADNAGMVYEIDKGWTFDGQAVNAFLKLAYYASKTPDIYKRYRRLRVDLRPEGWLSLILAVDFDYGNRTAQNNFPLQFTTPGGIWDASLWDTFLWDAPQYTQAVMKVEGEGYNIGLFFSSSAATDYPYTLYGASLQWSRRIMNRNTGND